MVYVAPLRPQLDKDTLKAAYESLRKFTPLQPNPFDGFLLIQQRSNSPVSLGENAIQQTIFSLLSEVLAGELARLRGLYGLSAPFIQSDLQTAKLEIERDSQQGNQLLIACSSLYYRYIRSDLDLSVDEIAELFKYEERSLHRFQLRFWEYLVHHFIQLETEARHRERERRCMLALPHMSYISLASQERKIAPLIESLIQATPSSLLIYGSLGVGKTTLAWRMSHRLIEMGHVHDVVWVNFSLYSVLENNQRSSETLAALVCESLDLWVHPKQHPSKVVLAYLRLLEDENQRLLIVLDGIDEWETAIEESVLWLSHVIVIATTRHSLARWNGLQMNCPLLDDEDSFRFLEYLDRQRGYNQPNLLEVHTHIWRSVGGNPAALSNAHLLIQTLPSHANLSSVAFREYYVAVWHKLSVPTQQLWLLIDLLVEVSPVDYHVIQSKTIDLLGRNESDIDQGLVNLFQKGFIEVFQDASENYTYQTPRGVWDFLKDTESIRDLIIWMGGQLKLIASSVAQELAWHLLNRIIRLVYPTDFSIELAQVAKPFVTRSHQWQLWESLLTHLLPNTLSSKNIIWIKTQLSIAQRIQGRLSQSLHTIEDAILLARREADGLTLAETLMEQSAVCFYLDQTPHAVTSAHEAHQIVSHEKNAPLLQRSVFLMAQALSVHSPAQSLSWLKKFKNYDASTWELISRLELQRGNLKEALNAAQQSLSLLNENQIPSYARAVGMVGRALVANGLLVEGISRFQTAINLLQNAQDMLGLARMLNNCGVALLESRAIDKAPHYFQQALQIYQNLEDAHGEDVTRDNLRYVEALLSTPDRYLHDNSGIYITGEDSL